MARDTGRLRWVTQIRSTAPGPERAFFGVGPVAVGVPFRYQTTDRERPLIAAEDAKTAVLAGSVVAALLAALVLGRRSRVHRRSAV